jgi:hypothetical protein
VTTDREARYLVDAYYRMQDDRKRSIMQAKAADKAEEANETIKWLAAIDKKLEDEIAKRLEEYTKGHPMGAYLRSVHGIGPIIAAGLLAHIDIEKCPTVGHIYQFAGIAGDGQKPWEKGELRPHNAKLRTLCWKIGQSFMKAGGYYGDIYRARKEYEVANNERGDLAGRAAEALEKKKYGKDTDAYKNYSVGRLPPAHLDARARRYAVKLFLAHFWEVWYETHFGKKPPLPYPIAHLGHAHYIPAPGIATDDESTMGVERAKTNESITLSERAKGLESTKLPERAIPAESTNPEERTKMSEGTTASERAPRRKRAA